MKYQNKFTQDEVDKRVWSIHTEPKFGIGQRCMLLQTQHGNVLWDLITYLDDETIEWVSHEYCFSSTLGLTLPSKIKGKGGLKGIVISHPHYYTTYANWARTFDCPVYTSIDDKDWLCQVPYDGSKDLIFLSDTEEVIVPGVTAIKIGGHFDGSLVLHWENKIFIADSLVTVPVCLFPGTDRGARRQTDKY